MRICLRRIFGTLLVGCRKKEAYKEATMNASASKQKELSGNAAL